MQSKKGVELTTGGEMLFKHISIACKHIFSAEEELALISERDRAIVRLEEASGTAKLSYRPHCRISQRTPEDTDKDRQYVHS